jgi:tricorn protease
LIIDVRFNRGGYVSWMLLEKLNRKIIGYDYPRHGLRQEYPPYSPKGPLVCITNELSGSDGDIFSHSFKLMKLGPLIGRRTWGGVIGINPRRTLIDGSIVTQPEYAFWFKDVGFGVENKGTEPDINVEIAPHDFADGRDPQLEEAISIALASLPKEKS